MFLDITANMSSATEETFETLLAQVVSDIKDIDEAKVILSDLLNEAERAAILKRLAVAIFLTNKESYDDIKRKLHVSSAMIARVQESLDTPGMKLAVEKVKIDNWASSWSRKLASLLEKILGK